MQYVKNVENQPAAKNKNGNNTKNGKNNKQKSVVTGATLLQRIAKIDHLPKTTQESIPLRGFMNNGIIETYPGTFTETFELEDVNFSIAPEEDQRTIYKNFMDLLNSFSESTKWQFTIFNHQIDKRQTIRQIRIAPQSDGLNGFRQEMNGILLNSLKKGNNSIKHEKYLTISIEDPSAEHAALSLRKLGQETARKIRKISKDEVHILTTQERMKLLYDIYNQDYDYRMATGVFNGEEKFDLSFIEKMGLSVKDVIGPSGLDFSKGTSFMVNDMYAQAMYLEHVPSFLTTAFLQDLSELQSNLLISITSEALAMDHAIKMVRSQLANIEGQAAAIQKRNGEGGVMAPLPPDLERAQQNARDLMNDIMSRDQRLFFLTVTLVVFAHSKEQLDENVNLVKSVAGKHMAPIKPMAYQQEFCFNTALPLCRNDVYVERLYTTEQAAVFIPYNSQEIMQKNAIFYGLNSTTKNMILYDRLTGANYNGLIFGYSGSGKSFTAKAEMISVLLSKPDSQVFVVDPQGEYYPLTDAFHGQHIMLSPQYKNYINPLDLDISENEDSEADPITMKSDFVISLFGIIIGRGRELSPIHTAILDKCTRKIYAPYLEMLRRDHKTSDPDQAPTLSDLFQELNMMKDEKAEAGQLADALYQYAVGSFSTFAHRTNVETNARFVVYDTKALGSGMKELGLHICIQDIWNRMVVNSKRNIYTWFYIDEFHVLLESEGTTLFLKRIWKMARKWKGVPTGIMQNTEDLLRSPDTRAIINNTSMVIMLKEPLMDRQNLAEFFNLSPAQLDYITDSDPGHGLIYNGKVTVPFEYDFPKNTELYKVMTTAHDVEGAKFQ
jgi:type IV secretory pathway VirB4 component